MAHIHNEVPHDTARWPERMGDARRFVYQCIHCCARAAVHLDPQHSDGAAVRRRGSRSGSTSRGITPITSRRRNIVLDEPGVQPRQTGEKLRVMFSPSHNRGGRWNRKHSPALNKSIESLVQLGRVEVVWPAVPISPYLLMALRKTCHVSIDEIVTGAFHQVSIEGMCAGNVVINRADYFARAMMACCARASELPPFVYADEKTIADVLFRLIDSPQETARLQMLTHEYFRRHLTPTRLVETYRDVYKTLH